MQVNPEPTLSHAFTIYEKAVYLRKLYTTSIVTLILSLASVAWSCLLYLEVSYAEYIILAFIDASVIVLCVVDIIWASRTPTHMVMDPNDDDDKYINQSQTLSYFHACLSQCCLAALGAGLYNMLQFGAYTWGLLALQILITALIVFAVYVGYMYTYQAVGQKRLTIYVSISFCLLVCAISSFYLKQVPITSKIQFILEVQLQLYQPGPFFCDSIKYFFLVMIIYLVIVAFINHRRVKLLFTPVSYILMVLIICGVIHNGIFIREIQTTQQSMQTDAGCRNTMSLISEDSLKSLGCSTKYKDQQYSPYLPCPQAQQAVMWEQDLKKASGEKLNTLACLNMGCCSAVAVNVASTTKSLVCWLNIFLALAYVVASNALMLSRRPFKMFQIRIYGDLVMLCVVGFIICGIVVFGYTYVPSTQFNVLPQIIPASQVQLDAVTVLPQPTFQGFKQYNPLNEHYNFGNCQLVKDLLLQPIDLSSTSVYGFRVAVQAQSGNFVIQNMFNDATFKIIDSPDAIKEVFGAPQTDTQYFLFEGATPSVQYFWYSCFYFCTSNPLNANFVVASEPFSVVESSAKVRNLSPHKHLAAAVEPPVPRLITQTQGTNQQGGAELNDVRFYTVEVTVEDILTAATIEGAVVEMYVGGYFTSSCSVVTQMYSPFLRNTTNALGQTLIYNLNMGMYFTAVIRVQDYINACLQLDFTLSNVQQRYTVGVSPLIPRYSMRVILEWYPSPDVNLQLQGTFDVGKQQCITGNLTNSCGGMTIDQTALTTKLTQSITIQPLEPYKYLFYVTRSLSADKAKEKLSQKQIINYDIITVQPQITLYVHEIDYPIVQFQLPLMNSQVQSQIDFNWLVFCLDGSASDTPIAMQSFWSDITTQDVQKSLGATKRTWPSASLC